MFRIRFSASRNLVPCTLYLKRAIRLCPSWREVHTRYAIISYQLGLLKARVMIANPASHQQLGRQLRSAVLSPPYANCKGAIPTPSFTGQ